MTLTHNEYCWSERAIEINIMSFLFTALQSEKKQGAHLLKEIIINLQYFSHTNK